MDSLKTVQVLVWIYHLRLELEPTRCTLLNRVPHVGIPCQSFLHRSSMREVPAAANPSTISVSSRKSEGKFLTSQGPYQVPESKCDAKVSD
jgi:hypothetical protein